MDVGGGNPPLGAGDYGVYFGVCVLVTEPQACGGCSTRIYAGISACANVSTCTDT